MKALVIGTMVIGSIITLYAGLMSPLQIGSKVLLVIGIIVPLVCSLGQIGDIE